MQGAHASQHLALLCPRLEGGGAERVMVLLARALAKSDRIDFLVTPPFVEAARAAVGATVNVVPIMSGARALPSLVRWVRHARPRAMLATLVGPNALAVAAARSIGREDRPRVVVREAHLPSAVLPYRPRFERALVPAVMRVAYRRADAVVALTDAARADLVSVLGPRAHVVTIPNPIEVTEIQRCARNRPPHAWLNGSNDARPWPVVVAAGRLVPKKGFDVLLRAFALLRARRDARLVILGEGPERGALEAMARALGIEPFVSLPGFVDPPHAFYAAADVFALSSHAEGMPNVILEALACGTPVVATDCPSGPRELLADFPGALVPVGDAAALARALEATLDAPRGPAEQHRSRAAAAAHDVAAIAARYREVLFPSPIARMVQL